MFVRVKKIRVYEYLYLVEDAREGRRHVQRVIRALGRRDGVGASVLLDGLIASAAQHSRRSIVFSRYYCDGLAELRPAASAQPSRPYPNVLPISCGPLPCGCIILRAHYPARGGWLYVPHQTGMTVRRSR